MTDVDDRSVLLSHIEDLVNLAGKTSKVYYTNFLSENDRFFCEKKIKSLGALHNAFGGQPICERKIISVFSNAPEPSDDDYPLRALKISGSGYRDFSHRDVLGSILSLGITREMLGDILIGDDAHSAFLYVVDTVSDFIVSSLDRVANDKVNVSFVSLRDVPAKKVEFEHIAVTVPSLRADALISEFLNISRECACRLISDKCVRLNHEELTKKEKQCSASDVFSIKGYGRYIVSDIGEPNRKNRIRVIINKYI